MNYLRLLRVQCNAMELRPGALNHGKGIKKHGDSALVCHQPGVSIFAEPVGGQAPTSAQSGVHGPGLEASTSRPCLGTCGLQPKTFFQPRVIKQTGEASLIPQKCESNQRIVRMASEIERCVFHNDGTAGTNEHWALFMILWRSEGKDRECLRWHCRGKSPLDPAFAVLRTGTGRRWNQIGCGR